MHISSPCFPTLLILTYGTSSPLQYMTVTLCTPSNMLYCNSIMYNESIYPPLLHRVQLSVSTLLLLYPCILQNCYKKESSSHGFKNAYNLHQYSYSYTEIERRSSLVSTSYFATTQSSNNAGCSFCCCMEISLTFSNHNNPHHHNPQKYSHIHNITQLKYMQCANTKCKLETRCLDDT